MTNELIVVEPRNDLGFTSDSYFERAVQYTLTSVNSPATKTVYLQTYKAWYDWCQSEGRSPLELNMETVNAYLLTMRTVKATRQRHLATLRKLGKILAAMSQNSIYSAAYESLILLKVPVAGCIESTRNKRALTPAQTDKVLRVWSGESNQHARNRALIGVLFMCGVRRAEAVAIKWKDVDLENGVIFVPHGKGDKARHVAIVGDFAMQSLAAWKEKQPEYREFVFCSIRTNDAIAPDKPICTSALYLIVKHTAREAGFDFSPHDARRTLITETLNNQVPLAEVQAQAGHANGSTTLKYAQSGDAKTRRSLLRLRYG